MLFAPALRLPSLLHRCLGATFLALGLALCSPVHAGEEVAGGDLSAGTVHPSALPRDDKSQYNLFNPTPDDLLRGFRSARPDQTTGAHSVDAGHFYLETGVAYSLGLGATRSDTWNYFQSTHVRAGLFNTVELELIWSGLDETRTQSILGRGRRSDSDIVGSNQLTVRTRFVIFGADKGPVAFAIDPEINLPTVSHHVGSEYVSGDLLLALSAKLPAGFSVTVNADPGITRNGADTRNLFGFTSGVTLYHSIFRKQDHVEPYLEYYDTLAAGNSDSRQVDVGVRWRPFPNFQFDFGCNFGVSADAPDYQPFFGIATRF